jgi:hypothetical protein
MSDLAQSKPAALQAGSAVVRQMRDLDPADCAALLRPFGLELSLLEKGTVIPGSYWGDREAGLIGNVLYCRQDTPVHSVLHEACHFICMDPARRIALDRDAGGDYDEENAVCYLQILLADYLTLMGAERMAADMDAWGYTFRLGSARAWFAEDAEDTRVWLKEKDLIDSHGAVTWRLRVD